MNSARRPKTRRGTVLLMIVGLLSMLFILVSAYIVLARSDRLALKLVNRSEQVTQIIDAINGVVAGAIRGSGNGDLVSGTAYVNAPGLGDPNDPNGNWGSPWLASPEPVLDLSTGGTLPVDYKLPAVTSLSSAPATDRRINELGLDANFDGRMEIVPVTPPSLPSSLDDTLANTQQMFTDADGDGIPDSLFGGVATLTELANAMGGRAVRATAINPANLLNSPTDPNNVGNALAWQQFDQDSRYVVAAKIVSHGGMVQVSAPTNVPTWNSAFTGAMFNWVKSPAPPDTGRSLDPYGLPADRNQLQALAAQSGAIEAVLRRRGGLLAGYGETLGGVLAQAAVPPALWTMQKRFPRTFTPLNWQRFNLANLDEWNLWRSAATIDATTYDGLYPGNPDPARAYYAPRQILTTVNNSDELARIEDPNGTNVTGFLPGKLKFYLGRITDLSDPGGTGVPLGAFLPNGRFNGTQMRPGYTIPQGLLIVRELSDYFKEMLQAYDGWTGASGSPTEVVSRTEQADMLAVNTVAFAAPRDHAGSATPGFIDNVWYPDGTKMYVGCAPQPFITQVIAYNKPDATVNTALAIELFNPNERYDDASGQDLHALWLPQFAISLNNNYESSSFNPTMLAQLVTVAAPPPVFPTRMSGRSFLSMYVNNQNANSYFEGAQANLPSGSLVPVINTLAVPSLSSTIRVKLWRQGFSLGGSANTWVLVDQFEIPTPNPAAPPPNTSGEYVDAWRDTNTERYWGTYPAGMGNPWENAARWRCAVGFPPTKPSGASEPAYQSLPSTSGQPTSRLADLAMPGPDLGIFSQPTVPLYMMNADAQVGGLRLWTMLHGAARPASFPTVGFLLYLPRFSHVGEWDSTLSWGWNWQLTTPPAEFSLRPATWTLYEQWDKKSYAATTYPADFGHMPVFDNSQNTNAAGAANITGGFDKTGRVPWGLLVFDYFTTLDPNDGNGNGIPNETTDPPVDPYRVPSRININAAPWYVLAGLPLIGPIDSSNPAASDLPCGYIDRVAGTTSTYASPAFWSATSGILAGRNPDGTVYRYPTYDASTAKSLIDTSAAAYGQWYRLGPYLAQAAASYRDRVPYVGAVYSPFSDAFSRNVTLVYRPPTSYGTIRQVVGTNPCRGFLSVGELANVMAFDGSTAFQITADPATASGTVLGGYALGVGGDFMKAVSLLALLDTQFLTTRSNTFTIYVTLTDRKNPQASVRSQMTIDRSNLLPRLIWQDNPGGIPNGVPELPPTDFYTTLQDTGPPELIGERQVSYFNARYDQ